MDVYGLIGFPLGHSFSKKYFTEKFDRENLAGRKFELFPLDNIDDLPALLDSKPELRGLAVTIPYKESVLLYLTALSDNAKKIGAVNCIKIFGGKLIGYNTDAIGFEKSLVPLLQSNHTKALLLGTGGASKAVQFILTKLGIEFLLVSRQKKNETGYIQYNSVDEKLLKEYPLIINATPVGMSPHENARPEIAYEYLDNKNLLYDLIYTPALTSFLKAGIEKGAVVKNGYEMLVLQAEENWRIWNDS